MSFVEKDLEILRGSHDVRVCHFRGVRDVWELWRGVCWSDLSFSWFGKFHAFLAVLFAKALGKKSVIVAGGDDVARYRVAGQPYGLFAHPFKKWFAHLIFGCADRIAAVSQFNLQETLRNTHANPEKARLVYHGFDDKIFLRKVSVSKEPLVVTVGVVNYENYYLKGLKLFVEAAHLLPDVEFMLVGPPEDGVVELLRAEAPPNLTLNGGCYGPDLIEILGRASVYVQASAYESFGCALAEAMLCECVPVVSRVAALPEVVGECGYYVEKLESREFARVIEAAMQDRLTGLKARERIARLFPLERRREVLLEVVDSALRR